jgi:hypothetical protein
VFTLVKFTATTLAKMSKTESIIDLPVNRWTKYLTGAPANLLIVAPASWGENPNESYCKV